jgi:hypothetical protein
MSAEYTEACPSCGHKPFNTFFCALCKYPADKYREQPMPPPKFLYAVGDRIGHGRKGTRYTIEQVGVQFRAPGNPVWHEGYAYRDEDTAQLYVRDRHEIHSHEYTKLGPKP